MAFDIQIVNRFDRDVRALREAYFAEVHARVPGYMRPSDEELAAENGITLVGYDADLLVACGALRMFDADTAEVKRMFVIAEARGRGYGRAMLRELEARARGLRCARVVLDTAAALTEAAQVYLKDGYVEIPPYNDNPVAARWFEKRL